MRDVEIVTLEAFVRNAELWAELLLVKSIVS
jgi:hypothetical protein